MDQQFRDFAALRSLLRLLELQSFGTPDLWNLRILELETFGC